MFEEAFEEGAEDGPGGDRREGDDDVDGAAGGEARPVGVGVGEGGYEGDRRDPGFDVDPLEGDRAEE